MGASLETFSDNCSLSVGGIKYFGIFNTKKIKMEWSERGDYEDYGRRGYFFSGAGLIIDKSTEEKHFFRLETGCVEDNIGSTLLDLVVDYGQKKHLYLGVFRPRLVNNDAHDKVVDLSLEKMISLVKKSEEAVPTVRPESLDVDTLVEMGLCYDRDGQLHIPVAKV